MNDEVTLMDISLNVGDAVNGLDELIKKSQELAQEKANLQKASKEEAAQLAATRQAYLAGTISQKEYNKAMDDSSAAQIQMKKDLLATNEAIKDNNQDIKTTKTLIDSEADSVNALRAQLSKNTKELNSMSAAQRLNSAEGQKLVAETKALTDRIGSMEKAVGDNRRNVGNYTDSITEALGSTKGLDGATGKLASSMSGSITSIKGFNAALKANPILFIVGVVLTLISTIEKLMKRNSEMANSLSAAFAPFKVLIGQLLDQITAFLGAVAKAIAFVADGAVKLAGKIGLISKETLAAAESAKQLELNSKAIYEAETDNLVKVQQLRREMETLKTLSADQNLTLKERADLNEQAIKKLKEMEAAELNVLQAKYDQIKASNELTYTSMEDRRAEAEAQAALEARRADFQVMEKELLGQMTGYRKTENDKQVAEAKAAAEAKARDEVEANKNAMAAQKEATAKMLSDMEQQLAAFDISLREKELEAGANKTQVELENLKAYNAEAIKLEQARYEKGLITKQEFLNKSAEMDLAVREAEAEIQLQQDEMNNERLAMDAQNRFDLKMIQTENEYEQRQIALDAAYEQEIAAAERVGADTTLITQKYAAAKAQVEKAQMNAKLSIASETAGQLSDLLGEESKAGKAFAVVQATINTYLGATKALATHGLAGIAQAAVIIAFGLKQVATIVKQKEPDTKVNSSTKKFAKGGQIYGASHAQGGVTFTGSNGQTFEAEGGENVYIMKRTASAEINALSSLNVSKGGRSFSTSGLYKFAEGGQVASISSYNAGSVMAGDVRLSKSTMQQLADVVIGAVSAMPNPVVTVQDINGGQADVRVLQNSATF